MKAYRTNCSRVLTLEVIDQALNMILASTSQSDCASKQLSVIYLLIALASWTLKDSVIFFEAKFFVKFGRLRFKTKSELLRFWRERYNRQRVWALDALPFLVSQNLHRFYLLYEQRGSSSRDIVGRWVLIAMHLCYFIVDPLYSSSLLRIELHQHFFADSLIAALALWEVVNHSSVNLSHEQVVAWVVPL